MVPLILNPVLTSDIPQIRLPDNILADKYRMMLDIDWETMKYSGTQEVHSFIEMFVGRGRPVPADNSGYAPSPFQCSSPKPFI